MVITFCKVSRYDHYRTCFFFFFFFLVYEEVYAGLDLPFCTELYDFICHFFLHYSIPKQDTKRYVLQIFLSIRCLEAILSTNGAGEVHIILYETNCKKFS